MKGVCETCGASEYKIRYYDHNLNELIELQSMYKKEAANHALQKAEWAIDRIKIVEGGRWLQRKVKKQADVIKRLEKKLLDVKVKPYAEEQ